MRHLADVEVVFREVTADPLEIHMSRTSPGRYALHEFAKNVFDVQFSDGAGRPLTATQPTSTAGASRSTAAPSRVRYRVFGDRIDGTYLGVDATQAHLNMPATLMWAEARDAPGARHVRAAARVAWTVATQLYPTAEPLVVHRAEPRLPHGQPDPVRRRRRCARSRSRPTTARRAAGDDPRRAAPRRHATPKSSATPRGVEKIVREARAVFGELPAFEPGSYTFLATYARAPAATAWSTATAPC